MAAFIDVEHALDPAYAAKLGVDVDNLYVSQPDTGEQALEITEALVRSGAVDVIVVDSVAALVPRAEIEGEMGDAHVGLQARLMSQALRKLSGAVKASNTCLIFTNQLRQKIGIMFGNPETTSGGMALKFYASVRLDIRRIQAIKHGGDSSATAPRSPSRRTRSRRPSSIAEFDIMYNQGISKAGDLLDIGVEEAMVDKRGASTLTATAPGPGPGKRQDLPGSQSSAACSKSKTRSARPGACLSSNSILLEESDKAEAADSKGAKDKGGSGQKSKKEEPAEATPSKKDSSDK